MKKIFLLVAALALLLAACGTDTPPPETTTAASAEATDGPGLYDPRSELEALTGGAVRCYSLEDSTATAVVPLGDSLLLFSGRETTKLTLLTGEDLTVSRTAVLDCAIDPGHAAVQVSENGVGYYDEEGSAVVFLDAALQETSRISMPADAAGSPALSPDLSTVYYCAGNQIRALDIQSGISRLVKELSCARQTITGICCGGTVLRCLTLDENEEHTTVFLSTTTGQTLYTGETVEDLETWGDSYFAAISGGSLRELVFGLSTDQAMALEPRNYCTSADPVLACGGAVTAELTGEGCVLDYYDLSSGLRTASLTLPVTDAAIDLVADPGRNVLWFLYDDAASGAQSLCCWDPARSIIEDDTVYTHKRCTAADPDTEGLARLEAEAAHIGETYGVEILLWKDALSISPSDYSYTAEHQILAYELGLARLEAALSRFPAGFLADSGSIRIALVRAIEGDSRFGTLDSVDGVQYWQDGDACIGLTLCDTLEQNAYHQLFHIIETRVYASTVTYDDWDKLNPKGFSYDYDYITNLDREGGNYLEGASRAFIDTYSMSFPREDRARIFEYAMLAGNESWFTSETMQKKLATLCTGIRKAYGLQKSEEILPWEQYLTS